MSSNEDNHLIAKCDALKNTRKTDNEHQQIFEEKNSNLISIKPNQRFLSASDTAIRLRLFRKDRKKM